MRLVELALLLLVAGVCGGIGRAVAGHSRGGCLVSIALGFIGALLGTRLADLLQLPEILTIQIRGHAFPIIWSIIGASLFVAILGVFTRRPGPGAG